MFIFSPLTPCLITSDQVNHENEDEMNQAPFQSFMKYFTDEIFEKVLNETIIYSLEVGGIFIRTSSLEIMFFYQILEARTRFSHKHMITQINRGNKLRRIEEIIITQLESSSLSFSLIHSWYL